MRFIERFNSMLAGKLADWLSTMAMFYGVAFLVLLPLVWQRPTSLVGWAQYLISVFFQGVALPVLGFVSKKEGERNTQILQETHDMVMGQLAIVRAALDQARDERDDLKLSLLQIGARMNRLKLPDE
jgi:Mn2+/Fe2+ NRAMP family transporter